MNPTLPLPLIRNELAGILRSDGFLRAQRMQRFLSFVVEETLDGRAGQLCEYSIGVSVFERGESFEPGTDPIVRNDARRLRQKLLEYYRTIDSEPTPKVIIDIPKGAYVPVFRTPHASCEVVSTDQYRLALRVIRIADGAEILTAQKDFAFLDNLNFNLDLQPAL